VTGTPGLPLSAPSTPETPAVAPGDADRPRLALRNVTVSFDGLTILDDLTLTLARGEMRFLIGPNGAGKTTLLDVITGKTQPRRGTVHFEEFDLAGARYRPAGHRA
jgi:urea transport system ATP-binding protein